MNLSARWGEALRRGLPADGLLLAVDLAAQTLRVVEGGVCAATYPVSTSRFGPGEEEGSHRTPTGFHRVVERYGAGLPPGTVFRSREPVGRLPPEAWRGGEGDLILTRILRLAGLEEGRNAGPGRDSYDRYIYLHGTNQEQLLGTPASAGCVRLGNADLAALFERVAGRETWCWIG